MVRGNSACEGPTWTRTQRLATTRVWGKLITPSQQGYCCAGGPRAGGQRPFAIAMSVWSRDDRDQEYPPQAMPVTPLHLGVGLLGKGVLPRHVSLTAFAISQVVIDVEVAYYMFVAREWPFHRWAHTFVGGALLGVAVGILVWLAGTWLVGRAGSRWQVPDLREASFMPALLGGLLGGLSHPVLDGVMHDDIAPLRPFSAANPFRGVVSYSTLAACLLAMACVGAALVAARARRLTASTKATSREV